MDGQRWNPESNIGDESVEPSRKRRKSQVDDLLILDNNNRITEGGEREEEDGPDWSQVLEEILELITAPLQIGDRIQSSRVCKRWRSIVVRASHQTSSSYGSPCLLRFLDGQRRKRFTLTDHFRNEHYIIDTPSIPPDTLIAHSSNGWLLLVKHCITYHAIFFFNPLTQATFELPDLPRDQVYMFAFWSEPTSSSDQCRVIAKPTTGFGNYFTSFCSWVPGEKEWNFFAIDHQENNFEVSNHKPFLIDDRIYHLDSRGRRIGIYNLSDQKLTVIGVELPIQIVVSLSVYYNFVKMDDKVVFVYKEEEDNGSRRRIHLYELDESNQQLVKLESTRGRSLFFCNGNCIFAELPTSGSGEDDESAWDFAYKNEIVVMSRACVMNKPQTVRTFEDGAKGFYNFNLLCWTNACWIDLKWS